MEEAEYLCDRIGILCGWELPVSREIQTSNYISRRRDGSAKLGKHLSGNAKKTYQLSGTAEIRADTTLEDVFIKSVTKTEHFWAPCRRLDTEKLPRGFVSGVLSGMGIPPDGQPFFLQKISDCAEEIANAAHNKREKILPMIVSASVLVDSHSLGDHQQQT
nr:uncharacterized RING finger protein P4H10.07-like [Ipomoea batatas]